jgi:L-fucose mutarotase/ribose pyranase (RbsD/FucU family)
MTDSIPSAVSDWELQFHAVLRLFGHRNWIVIADSAYPAQAKPGIETIMAEEDQIPVVRTVLDAITASGHIRPTVYVDAELGFVAESDAPGITEYRRQLDAVLRGSEVKHHPHEQIIQTLDQSAQLFRIMVIKTNMTIPYTAVFFELDCGYWNAAAEERLRQVMMNSDAS